METLPKHVKHFKTTPVFTRDTVPEGLLKAHKTKSNVWGLICVSEGSLEYVIKEKETHIITPANKGVVAPEISHHVKPLGDVSFYVEFYK